MENTGVKMSTHPVPDRPLTTSTRFTRRSLLLGAAGFTTAALLGTYLLTRRDSTPNILLILVDDMGRETLGCYGGESYVTPNIDRLAARGTRFTHCYCTPMCTPSRAQLVTGRYPYHTGVTKLRRDLPDTTLPIDPTKEPQLGRILRSAGYATAVAGKWQLANLDEHPTHVNDCGFDEYSLWVRYPRDGKQVRRYWKPNVLQDGQLLETTIWHYGPDIATKYLIDFMRRNRTGPFLAYYPMTLVHGPFSPPPEIHGGKRTTGKRTTDLGYFKDMVEYMDHLVGKLIDELEQLNIRDETLVLLTGDNGLPRSVVSLMDGEQVRGGKRTLTDLGIRVPLIANQPGVVPAGRVYDELVDFSDFLPTLADVAGAALPQDKPPLDGRSFAAQLSGAPGPTRDWIISQYSDDLCIRTKRWKLMSNGELYDMIADPTEQAPMNIATVTGEAAEAVATLAPILKSCSLGTMPGPAREERG